MSDNKHVALNTKLVARDNSAGGLSMGEVAVRQCHDWLHEIAKLFHRGPHDTWTAARDRAAEEIGIEPSYAARIWHRSQTMRDVSGGAYRRIQETYTALCESAEAFERKQAIEAERIALEAAEIMAARSPSRDRECLRSEAASEGQASVPQARSVPPY